jgi:shikimate dehydrogenase
LIRAGVLGSPISHSLSPLLHATAYKELGIAYSYEAIKIESGGLSDFIATLDSSWTGFSLTMPLKEEAVVLADVVDDVAAQINSANTLNRRDGKWEASSTDVMGFTTALQMHEVPISGHVVILGAGATARAAAAACDGLANHITIVNRSIKRIEAMSAAVQLSQLSFVEWSGVSIIEDADLVISTTPAGITDSMELPSNVRAPFFEALYKPWPTITSSEWAKRGGFVIDGLDLLIHQGMAQMEIFSGVRFDNADMYSLLRRVGISALK